MYHVLKNHINQFPVNTQTFWFYYIISYIVQHCYRCWTRICFPPFMYIKM
jgi:hypothetical protein